MVVFNITSSVSGVGGFLRGRRHVLLTTSGTKKQEGHKSIIQLANMTSFKLKSAHSSAMWRIQYHKNLITDTTIFVQP